MLLKPTYNTLNASKAKITLLPPPLKTIDFTSISSVSDFRNFVQFRFSLLSFLSFFFIIQHLSAQSVGIFGSTNLSVNNTGTYANSSAVFDISSSDKGLLIPRLTKAQRDGIATPATSLIIYQTDNTPGYYFYNATAWSLLKVDNGNDCFTNVDVINTSGTWTAPAGVTKIMVQVWGAGGGGGGGASGSIPGGGCGGGGGAYAKKFITVVPGNNYSVTIGIGGAGGSGGFNSNGSPGSNGGASNFDAFIIANGGSGGDGGIIGVACTAGGAGGTTTASLGMNGLPGNVSTGDSKGTSGGSPRFCLEGSNVCTGGTGGDAAGGGGVPGGNGNLGLFGLAEGGGGGGRAAGGNSGGSGGAGTNGKVLVWY